MTKYELHVIQQSPHSKEPIDMKSDLTVDLNQRQPPESPHYVGDQSQLKLISTAFTVQGLNET